MLKTLQLDITFLGTGTSQGIPIIGSNHPVCLSDNIKDKRLRSSICIIHNDIDILIDCGPDFRQQAIRAKLKKVDAVLFTHEHSDHTAGLPDMRAISLINKSIIPAYLSADIHDSMISNYKYIFRGLKDYSPFMTANILEDNFKIDNTEIKTFKHNHGSIDAQTYRINNFAYSTDIKSFYEDDIDKLKNLDLWIVGLLRYDPHPSHAGFEQILEFIDYLKPKKTLFTHMTALLDQKDLLSKCPDNVEPAYDGLEITL